MIRKIILVPFLYSMYPPHKNPFDKLRDQPVEFVLEPATPRLPPDSTLVLVNGNRRHRSSAIGFWTYGVVNGAHGADVGTIPAIALDRVEVLRDGAAAQDGSDAVAGVLNFGRRGTWRRAGICGRTC